LKKVLSLLLTTMLIIGLIPIGLTKTAEAASGNFFVFPNESYDVNTARVVNTKGVDLNGSINNVTGNISYSVYNIVQNQAGEWEVVASNIGQTGGITVNGYDIKVTDLGLYSGMNKITFKGTNGSKSVEESIYIEFRNGPTLSNLKASMSGQTVDLSEEATSILTASPRSKDFGKDSTEVIISGVAKNATSVIVTVNKKSWSYNVSSYNNYQFTAASIKVNVGKNLITIKAVNGDQSVETTRELTFNNGKSTFYDTYLKTGAIQSPDLASSPDFNVTAAQRDALNFTGKAILPIAVDGATFSVNYKSSEGAAGDGTVDATVESLDKSAGYTVISYEITDISYSFDQTSKIELEVISSTDPGNPVGNYTVYFTLHDQDQPYIYEVNYLDSYGSTTTPAQALNLSGTPTAENSFIDIYSLPAAFEVLVVNGTSATNVELEKITDSKGNVLTGGTTYEPNVARVLTTQVINGVQTSVMRVIVSFKELPSDGSQFITLKVGNSEKTFGATLLYGPYVQFEKLYEGQQISVDSTSPTMKDSILTEVGKFSGTLLNVSNENTIELSDPGQTVYLYVNNTLVELTANGSANKFILSTAGEEAAKSALTTGKNVIKFVYKSGKSSYTKNVTINVMQTNVPEIPVEGTLGVIPFTTGSGFQRPTVEDSKFTRNNDTYTTKATEFKIYGTFDFVDLGDDPTEILGSIDALDQTQYSLNISSSEDTNSDGITWDLSKRLYPEDNDLAYDMGKSDADSDLRVYYNEKGQYFSFILIGQELPTDGSPVVYNFTVTSNGATSTYRIELVYERTVFNVVRPLKEKRILNQNFVEVVVSSETADSVMVGKVEAEKVAYDGDLDGDIDGEADYPHAFRAVVTDLKANKDTKIKIVVKEGDDELEETITVKYVPTNIPGAQYMEEMSSSHKVFDGALSLKFTKGTSLIRRDYDVPEQLKNQVFSGHQIRFAIGNKEDGVVDRHEFEVDYDDYNYLVNAGQQYFISNFPTRFAKASPVFWIDAGIADDIETTTYDPVTQGADPYQFDFSDIPSFYNRNPENELVPSKRGELTLSFDSALAQDAGRLVTVFHFDPENGGWENIGGVVDAKKHTITVPFERFGYYVVGKLSSSYTDIIDHPYGRDYIETIYAKGVMNPVDPANEFGVYRKITRAEFTRMIVKAQELSLNYTGVQHFGDVAKTPTVNLDALWDYRYIETAARAGYVKGWSPGAFNPDAAITRQDASVIIAKALNLKLETDRDKVDKGLAKYFKDYSTIDYYARPSVLAIANKGFITGSPVDTKDLSKGYNFNPEASTLRGDAAIIMSKVMISQKKLPQI